MRTITISNLAGGDARRFRVINGQVTGAMIRHARMIESRTYGGWTTDGTADQSMVDEITQALADDANEDGV